MWLGMLVILLLAPNAAHAEYLGNLSANPLQSHLYGQSMGGGNPLNNPIAVHMAAPSVPFLGRIRSPRTRPTSLIPAAGQSAESLWQWVAD